MEEREAANKKKMAILKGKASSAGAEDDETNQTGSPRKSKLG